MTFRFKLGVVVVLALLLFWKGPGLVERARNSSNSVVSGVVDWFDVKKSEWSNTLNEGVNNSITNQTNTTSTSTTTTTSTSSTTIQPETTSTVIQVTACSDVDLTLDDSTPEWCEFGSCPNGEKCQYFESFGSVEAYCGCVNK